MVSLDVQEQPVESAEVAQVVESSDRLHPVAVALAHMSREDRDRLERLLMQRELRKERGIC